MVLEMDIKANYFSLCHFLLKSRQNSDDVLYTLTARCFCTSDGVEWGKQGFAVSSVGLNPSCFLLRSSVLYASLQQQRTHFHHDFFFIFCILNSETQNIWQELEMAPWGLYSGHFKFGTKFKPH